ncbi:MAG: hypothetical protein ABSB82_01105 [Terriglobia bacterium]
MRFRGEFRAKVIERGEIVELLPTDESGNRRQGVVVRLHDQKATKMADGWGPADRVFLYHESDSNGIEIGYFNDRTKERIPL